MSRESKVAVILSRFVTARERALIISGHFSGLKASAVSKIRRVVDFMQGKSEREQLAMLRQIESELYLILPHPESRFAKLRSRILDLIDRSHAV